MPIVKKPRRISIELDPDQGFPVGIQIEYTCHIEEGGVNIANLPADVATLDPGSEPIKAVMGDVAAAATAALLPYQSEVQRLGLLLRAHGIQF